MQNIQRTFRLNSKIKINILHGDMREIENIVIQLINTKQLKDGDKVTFGAKGIRVNHVPCRLEEGKLIKIVKENILGTEEDMILRPLEDDVDLCVLRQALGQLPEREREIVAMRFGLEGRKELTQKEVAQKMGISQSYISRLEKRIINKLKKEMVRML